jgi:hypothetical protein
MMKDITIDAGLTSDEIQAIIDNRMKMYNGEYAVQYHKDFESGELFNRIGSDMKAALWEKMKESNAK